tara:strand:+ start:359 stop:499 length:141 start_codon:yes stop_codon:yes gene_type:complete
MRKDQLRDRNIDIPAQDCTQLEILNDQKLESQPIAALQNSKQTAGQ